jgi:prevent-host-death family protein
MREVGAFEAKNTLGTLLDWVERGEEVLITRRGRAVARLVPAAPSLGTPRAQQAAERLRARQAGLSLKGLVLADLIAEGRR